MTMKDSDVHTSLYYSSSCGSDDARKFFTQNGNLRYRQQPTNCLTSNGHTVLVTRSCDTSSNYQMFRTVMPMKNHGANAGSNAGRTSRVLYWNDFEKSNSPVRHRPGTCTQLADGTINEYFGGQIDPSYGDGRFGQVETVEVLFNNIKEDGIHQIIDPTNTGGTFSLGMQNRDFKGGNDELWLDFDTPADLPYFNLELDLSPIDINKCANGDLNTGSAAIAPKVAITLKNRDGTGSGSQTKYVTGHKGANGYTYDWVHHPLTFDLTNLSQEVRLHFDLIDSAYAAIDNLLIYVDKCPSVVELPGMGVSGVKEVGSKITVDYDASKFNVGFTVDWGDGTAKNANTTYAFSSPGAFTVTATAEDQDGCRARSDEIIDISPASTSLPTSTPITSAPTSTPIASAPTSASIASAPTSALITPASASAPTSALITPASASDPINPASRTGSSSGDPHFVTFGGEKYDFHGGCDLVLLDSPHFANGLGLTIHIRTKVKSWWSYIESAVVKIGDETLELMGSDKGEGARYWVNGLRGNTQGEEDPLVKRMENVLVDYLPGFKVHYKQVSSKQHKFRLDLNLKGDAVSLETFKDFVSVNVKATFARNFEGAKGLMGQYPDGARVGRYGENQIIEEVNSFGKEWQVLSTEQMLFHAAEGPQHPAECVLPSSDSNVKTGRRRLGESVLTEQEAAAVCAHVPWKKIDSCIFDVLATNDKDYAGAY